MPFLQPGTSPAVRVLPKAGLLAYGSNGSVSLPDYASGLTKTLPPTVARAATESGLDPILYSLIIRRCGTLATRSLADAMIVSMCILICRRDAPEPACASCWNRACLSVANNIRLNKSCAKLEPLQSRQVMLNRSSRPACPARLRRNGPNGRCDATKGPPCDCTFLFVPPCLRPRCRGTRNIHGP